MRKSASYPGMTILESTAYHRRLPNYKLRALLVGLAVGFAYGLALVLWMRC